MRWILLLFLAFCSLACRHEPCKIEERTTSSEKTEQTKKIIQGTQMTRVKIFKPDGSLQCNQGEKIDLDIMAKDLKDITIYSRQNLHDGLMRAQMCGRPTGYNNVYEIDLENFEKAQKLGFNKWIRD